MAAAKSRCRADHPRQGLAGYYEAVFLADWGKPANAFLEDDPPVVVAAMRRHPSRNGANDLAGLLWLRNLLLT